MGATQPVGKIKNPVGGGGVWEKVSSLGKKISSPKGNDSHDIPTTKKYDQETRLGEGKLNLGKEKKTTKHKKEIKKKNENIRGGGDQRTKK